MWRSGEFGCLDFHSSGIWQWCVLLQSAILRGDMWVGIQGGHAGWLMHDWCDKQHLPILWCDRCAVLCTHDKTDPIAERQEEYMRLGYFTLVVILSVPLTCLFQVFLGSPAFDASCTFVGRQICVPTIYCLLLVFTMPKWQNQLWQVSVILGFFAADIVWRVTRPVRGTQFLTWRVLSRSEMLSFSLSLQVSEEISTLTLGLGTLGCIGIHPGIHRVKEDRVPNDPTATVVLSLRSQQALALSRQLGGVAGWLKVFLNF